MNSLIWGIDGGHAQLLARRARTVLLECYIYSVFGSWMRMWDINRYTVLAFGVMVVDQALDMFIELVLPIGASVMLITDWFGIKRFDGPSGGALDTNGFFTLLAIVLIPFFVRFRMRPIPDALYGFGISLMIGGLLGNLADGLRVGYPIDYLVIGHAFNLADAALLIGASILIYRLRRRANVRLEND